MADIQTDQLLARIKQLAESGQSDQADALCRSALQQVPMDGRFWAWLGMLALTKGNLDQAELGFRKATQFAPQSARNWGGLGGALYKMGRAQDAESCFRNALQLDPSSAGNWGNLAATLIDQEKWNAATEALKESIRYGENDAEIWANLAKAELKCGNIDAARAAYVQSLSLGPSPEVAVDYAALLGGMNEFPLALHVLNQVTRQEPTFHRGWEMAGDVLTLLGDQAQAEESYRRALELAPNSRTIQKRLCDALRAQHRQVEAEQFAGQLIESDPQDANAWETLASIQLAEGKTSEAIESARQAVHISADAPQHGRFLLAAMQYSADVDPEKLLVEHREWASKHARPQFRITPPANRTKAISGRLRIGFLSANFGRHPVAFLALPGLEHLDRERCSLVCYSDRTDEDDFTPRFRSQADEYYSVAQFTDKQLVDRIASDNIDVLFDLMGYTGRRQVVFAARPARVQIAWLGYPGTTGIQEIDYLLADGFHVRPGEESWYSELVLRLPHSYACYGPPHDAPDVNEPPVFTTGRFTFGSFNNPAKYSPFILDAWASILRQVPSSQLLLMFGGLQEDQTQGRIQQQFAARGVSPERVMMGYSPPAETLAEYHRVDLALDTQPYSGGLTTCEALWMGVPVVTLPGKTFAGRHSFSYLSTAGLDQFVVPEIEGYVKLAVEYASRTDELVTLRATMRERIRVSPLFDAARFAEHLLNAVANLVY